jgi:Tfp pilus assembly protein PilX
MTDHRHLDEGRPPSVRTLITVLVTIVIVGVVLGVVAVASLASESTRTAANRIDVGDDPQLAIRSTDADVRLVEGDSSDVVIRAKVTSGILDTSYELRRRGPEIEIVGSCANWLSPGCGVVVTVAVPAKLPVLVATDSADVTVDGLRDRVVTIATGSGDIRGGALQVQEFSATTDAGDVVTTFDGQPFALKARTKSGDISARIPTGDIDYAVTVRSKTGDVQSELESEPDAKGIVRVVSDSGDIQLRR